MPYKKPVSVLVVIHTPALEVLLLERAAHPGFFAEPAVGMHTEFCDAYHFTG